jgi:hypothetical protein
MFGHSSEYKSSRILFPMVVWIALMGRSMAEPKAESGFPVKYILAGMVYIDGGSNAGLLEGQKLTIKRKGIESEEPSGIGEVEIESVALISASAKILSAKTAIIPGDIACFSESQLQEIKTQSAAKEIEKYAQLVSFTDGAPPDQEVRESLPKPPLPEVNRIKGRVAADYSQLQIPGSPGGSLQVGFVLRLDATRIAGTHWKISGYHRGRFQSRTKATQQQTLTDLINRTYHLSLTYENPDSRWIVGAGRLLIPWAASLNTVDGFYLGRRYGKQTVGIFGGANPDPTSWNYSRDRQTAGFFVNTERGSFESLRISSTSGVALSRLRWRPDRQFGFFENGILYRQVLSVYSNIEADMLNPAQNSGKREIAFSRSYFTVRLQPHKIISFDLNENYFRNIPTFDASLIGTGLLDKYLFQGLSGGFRLQLPHRLGIFSDAGRSSRSGDSDPSWNYLFGGSAGDVLHTGVRIEYRYSKFDSSFGQGTYQSVFAIRDVGESLRFELQAGHQAFSSALTAQNRARFINGNVDCYLGPHYYLGFGATVYRGDVQRYNQYFINLGFRFDNRHAGRSW